MIVLRKYVQVKTIFSAFSSQWGESYQFSGERHNFWELFYIEKGYASVLKEDKIYDLSKGEMIFFKPMEFHRYWVEKGEKLTTAVISFSLDGIGSEKIGDGIYKPDEEAVKSLYKALDAACYCNNYDDNLNNQIISNSLEKLLLKLLEVNTEPSKKRRSIGNINYQEIIRVMNENVNKKLSIKELAELCNMSESNLKKTFRKFSGMGVMEYFNRLKIKEALKLLEENITIGEISEMLGFSSHGYFCEVFKKQCGRSPVEYRKAYKDSRWYFTANI